jgi:hypothetical protein
VSGPGGYDGRLSLSLPLGDSFGLGVTGRYVSFWREGSSNAPPFAEGITFDAAARVTPVAGLHIAAFGYNLIDLGSSLVPRQAGGSISYTYDNRLTLAFDGIADLGTFENPDGSLRPEGLFGGAGEYFTGEVPIRVGYYYDTGRDLHVLTGGLGYITEDFGVEVSLRQQVNRTQLTTILASFPLLRALSGCARGGTRARLPIALGPEGSSRGARRRGRAAGEPARRGPGATRRGRRAPGRAGRAAGGRPGGA